MARSRRLKDPRLPPRLFNTPRCRAAALRFEPFRPPLNRDRNDSVIKPQMHFTDATS